MWHAYYRHNRHYVRLLHTGYTLDDYNMYINSGTPKYDAYVIVMLYNFKNNYTYINKKSPKIRFCQNKKNIYMYTI